MEDEEIYNEDFENLSDIHKAAPKENENGFDEEALNSQNLEELENELLQLEEKKFPSSPPEQKPKSKSPPAEKIKKEPPVKPIKRPDQEKPPLPKSKNKEENPPAKKKEDPPSYSRQNSVGSGFSNKNIQRQNTKEKSSIIRSHSSRSRQDDFLYSKEDNPYTKKVDSLLQEKDYDKLTDKQIIQENNLLRMHLKSFNKELNLIIERQALKPVNKANEVHAKPQSAKMRNIQEEIKNNEKKLTIFKEDLNKLSSRMDNIGDGTHMIKLQEKIENTAKAIEDLKKSNKVILLDQKKQAKNLDNIENVVGMPDKLARGNEISSLLPSLTRKNQHLKDKNDYVMIQIEELERKNETIQPRYEKAMQLADAYKLFRNDKKRESYEITQAKVEAFEKNIQTLNRKNEKVVEMHRKTMDDLQKALKEKDEMISTREKELLIQRQKIEELMMTEKINKDSLMKILPPTPKTNTHLNIDSKRKLETPVQQILEGDREDSRFASKDEPNMKESDVLYDSGNRSLHNKEIAKEEKKIEKVAAPKEEENNEKNNNSMLGNTEGKKEEPSKSFNFSNKGTNLTLNNNKESENNNSGIVNKESEIIKSTKNEEQSNKTFNFSKNPQPPEEQPKSFNFSKKKEEPKPVLQETNSNSNSTAQKNNENAMKPPLKNEPNPIKRDRKVDLFNNADDNNGFGFIPEIKTIDNTEKPSNNTNFNSNKNETLNNKKEEKTTFDKKEEINKPILTSNPQPTKKKIIADPFDEKPKIENYDNEFFEEGEAKGKKLKMGISQKKTDLKQDLLAKAEKGENDFFDGFE